MPKFSNRWLCIALVATVVLSNPTSGCLKSAGILQLDVPDRSVFEIGDEIRINCRLENNTYTDASGKWHIKVDHSYLRFKLNSKLLDQTSPLVEYVDNNTIAFVKKNATEADSTTIMCLGESRDNNNSSVRYAGCHSTIVVGKPPLKVLDFKCTSNAFRNMTCNWKIPENRVNTVYKIEVSSGVERTFGPRWQPCPADQTTPTSCTWTSETTPLYNKFSRDFNIRINGTNPLGTNSWEFFFNHGDIVKLSPILSLKSTLVSPTQANLSWEAPIETKHGAWKADLVLMFQLMISRENDSHTEYYETSETTSTISNLLPNKKYLISVRARTNTTQRFDLYSDPVTITIAMAKDKPYAPPALLPSGFKYKLFNNVRTVTLLFDEIPKSNWNDDHLEYIVQVCSHSEKKCNNITTEHTNFDLEDLSVSKRYSIDVWSSNSLGTSSSSSNILIGPQHELLAVPTDVVVMLGNRSASLSWKTPQTLAKQTDVRADVYWCESHDQKRCQGKINILSNVTNNESARIEVDDPRDFIYGVALSENNGPTSGSVWSVCEINSNAHVGQVRELQALPDTQSTLKLLWRTGCGYQRRDVEGYQVEICHLEEDAEDALEYAELCQHRKPENGSLPCRVENFTISSDEDVYVLSDLQKNEVYRVVLRAIDGVTHKFAPDSIAVCAATRGVGLPVHIVVGLAIGSALVFTLVFSVLYFLVKRMRGELHSAITHSARLPATVNKIIDKRKQLNRATELKVFDENSQHQIPLADDRFMTSVFANGSHSGSEMLISPSTVDGLPAQQDSTELSNLNREPPVATNNEVANFVPQPLPNGNSQFPAPRMPSYTQLGLSASHFVAVSEPPRYTGYSQLSVVPTTPAAAAEEEEEQEEEGDDNAENDGENNDDEGKDGAPTPEPEGPPRRAPQNSNYIALDAAFNRNNCASNGYVPAYRAKE